MKNIKQDNREIKEWDLDKAIEAQHNLCKSKGYPYFAPVNGFCHNCKKNIFEKHIDGNFIRGIDVDKASKELITGCPHCSRSFCE